MMRAMRWVVVLAACAPASTGCEILEPDGLDELREHRRLWESQGMADYRYVLERSCFCPVEAIGPVEITVRGGQVVSRTFVETGDPVSMWLDNWPTVDGLFDLLQRALDGDADQVDVTYHRTLGYPLTADIDYLLNAIDDELGLTVASLESIGSM